MEPPPPSSKASTPPPPLNAETAGNAPPAPIGSDEIDPADGMLKVILSL